MATWQKESGEDFDKKKNYYRMNSREERENWKRKILDEGGT